MRNIQPGYPGSRIWSSARTVCMWHAALRQAGTKSISYPTTALRCAGLRIPDCGMPLCSRWMKSPGSSIFLPVWTVLRGQCFSVWTCLAGKRLPIPCRGLSHRWTSMRKELSLQMISSPFLRGFPTAPRRLQTSDANSRQAALQALR